MHLHREKAFADANLYDAQKTAEADALYLSDEYLELLAQEAVTEKATIGAYTQLSWVLGGVTEGLRVVLQCTAMTSLT